MQVRRHLLYCYHLSMSEIQRIVLKNGVTLFPFVSKDEVVDYADKKKCILIAMNAGKVGRSSEEMVSIINRNVGYADGIAAVAVLKKRGIKNAIKIPGCELWLDIVSRKYKDSTFYLVGGKQEVIDTVVEKLQKDFPGIHIAGYRNGYMSDQDEKALIDDIATKKPDVVFVAMGSPKQELLMERMQSLHPAIYQGLGGSFDVYTGRMKRAPEWWIKHNLEGPYRVMTDLKKWKRFVQDLWVMVKIKLGCI